MTLVKRVIKWIFLVNFTIFLFFTFYTPPLPPEWSVDKKILDTDPIQQKIKMANLGLYAGDLKYEVRPEYSYELWGLVVSQHDSKSFLDIYHKKDPANTHDVCVVWGKNVANGSYRDVKYESGDYVCIYKWGPNVRPGFSGRYLSNNHLVPSNSDIAKIIANTSMGDQIYIKGYLSTYKIYDKDGNLKLSRGTSISRDDTGNGACETIYVTDYKILKHSDVYLLNKIRNISKYFVLASSFISIILFLFF